MRRPHYAYKPQSLEMRVLVLCAPAQDVLGGLRCSICGWTLTDCHAVLHLAVCCVQHFSQSATRSTAWHVGDCLTCCIQAASRVMQHKPVAS